ncbi:MAG: cryptochrome/photolyase family protein [Chitinophagaceae bacterium]|nr:cryptochrome/photolyase family protein [Chitinophagaceae bacterium]
MQEVVIIFPHQLFPKHPAVKKNRPVIIVEEYLFFRQYKFHKQKLILHRATMKMYENYLRKKEINVRYVEALNESSDVRKLIPQLKKNGCNSIHIADPVDDWLKKRILNACNKYSVKPVFYHTPNFLSAKEDWDDFFSNKKKYFQTEFYIEQRKKRKLLLEDGNKPIGGKWSYDTENRKKIPAGESIPTILFPEINNYVKEAIQYVKCNFSENYGEAEPFLYPVTYEQANQWLEDFLHHRFRKFGIYEDAMMQEESFLFHSVLTPVLNIGLLDPEMVIQRALTVATEKQIPLNSLEGFIRQIIGWREFIRIVYEREGVRQRNENFWGFKRKIPDSFYCGNTGIEPVDIVIRRLLKTGYCHHIERLMVLGNFIMLCEIHPDEVYRWFMEMFVDSYDWVMVPNVYGMSQFADGGLMCTKPYISGSNYLLKMGNWPKGSWTEIWDALFWRFMDCYRNILSRNPRLNMLINTFDRMPNQKKINIRRKAEKYLNSITT